MQEMKRKVDGSGNNGDVKKERHIVTWSQQEDDILREQITIHGTDNWVIIASKFKDKTARQCRRRWYTYLNSDFKKGGWSPEEDMLLCEAQKIFGNRWTEISKVVAGRTDNAVKNRFTTLCKKRAKYEALTKENNFAFINTNNKRVISYNTSILEETSESAVHTKRLRRTQVPDLIEACNIGERSYGKCRVAFPPQQPRTPFSVVVSNIHNNYAAKDSKNERTFLSKDDPKATALMQQAELLGSLALKVNTESTCQSLENAWKVLEDFLSQAKGGELHEHKTSNIDFQQENFKDLLKELESSIDGSQSSREPDLCETSPASSDYSTGSTILLHGTTDGTEPTRQRGGILDEYIETETAAPPIHTEQLVNDQNVAQLFHATTDQENLQSIDEQINESGVGPAPSHTEFGSPLEVTPLFGSLAAGIPSPKFSESEKNFIMKTLGMESPCPIPSINPSHPPACKRALLQNP